MTGANNKTAYDRDIQEIDLKLTSHENQVFGIAVFDVNGLKEINDNYGHESGNYLISDASDAIRAAFPKDRVYRIGGDEFVLIFEGRTDEEIDKCIAAIREESSVKFSAGTYNDIPHGRQKSWDYLEFADMELYKEKKYKKRSR